MVKAKVLRKIQPTVFRKEKMADSIELNDGIDYNKIVLCMRTSDGSYYEVNSEISEILSKYKGALTNKGFKTVVNKFHNEQIHGERFLLYPQGDKALLLGNLFFGLKKLSKLK